MREGAAAGWPVGVHAIGDAANTAALDAFERSQDVWRAARPAAADRARAVPRPGRRPALRGARRSPCRRSSPTRPSDEHLAKRFWAGPPRRHVLVPLARRLGRASSRTAPTRRSRSSTRGPASSPASSTTGARISGSPSSRRSTPSCVAPAWLSHDERTRGTLVPGRYADLVVLDRDPLACEPEELREVQVVATMLGGRWTHNPPPWD